MSCRANDILIDKAIDKVDRIMELNPSIPEEMRDELIKEEYFKSLENDGNSDDYWESQLKEEE